MSVYIQKVGRWDIAGLMLRNLKKDIPEELTVALRQIGAETEGLMKKRIVSQPSEWQPLGRKYFYHKWIKGESTKTLIRSSSMLQSITSYAAYPYVFVGVKRGVKNKEGDELANIAAIMEFGSVKRNIPARSFIEPVATYQLNRIRNENLFGQRIIKYLKKKYSID